jgi:Carboxypeptidase regulatory-like domain
MRSTFLAILVLCGMNSLNGRPILAAQGVGASGDLTGTVSDPSGGGVPNAKITATDIAKGVQRAVETDEHGFYRLSGLPPATYKVGVEHSGFQTQVMTNVMVTVGQTIVLDFALKLSGVSAQVEVTSELPAVETERGSQSNTLNEQLISELPIDRRDYLTFTLLMPGVSDSTRVADDQDYRVKQTPQSGLSFYGSNGRGNSVTVDGGEANTDSGGVRLTVSQDDVQEFQVNRSNYGADLGGASGASINIVTKSGANQVHGGFYSYFRNDALDAQDPFAYSQALQPGAVFNPEEPDTFGTPVKNALSRYQYGATAGAPIRKDKTFVFFAFEGLLQNAQTAVPLLTSTSIFRPTTTQDAILTSLAAQGTTPVTCFTGQPQMPAAECAGILQDGLTVSQSTGLSAGQTALNIFLINQLEDNGGLFNYNSREYLASGRVDHRISDNDQLFVSYRYGHDLEENPDVQSLTGFSAGSSIHNYDDNIMAGWFHQFSASKQNEFRAQFDYNSFNVIPNEAAEVGLQIFGYANNLGTNIFLPNLTITRRTEIVDNFTLSHGQHTFKFGFGELLRGNHTESHTFMPGRFVFGSLPGSLISPQLADTTIDSLQAASFGLPQIYQQGFGNPDYPAYTRPLTSFFAQDSWRVFSNFTLTYGLRYEIDSQFLPLNTYYGDVGPRASFAWDVFKDHKTVVRGGYGIFYGPIDAQIPQVDLSLGVLNKNYSTVENQHNSAQVPNQVDNAIATCGIGFPGVPIVAGTGTSPCTRFISIYVDSLNPTGLPIANAATVFQTLFGEGLIQCTTPTADNSACITPASVAPFGIFVANSGQLSPLTVLFSNPPNYKTPYSQQASIGIEREIAPGFTFGVSGIYTHTLRLPVALDTNLLNAPMSTVTLANGKSYSYRNWNTSTATDPIALVDPSQAAPCAANPFACFVNPLIVQNNQYSSAAAALYEGLILEVKKRFSNSFSLMGNYTFSKGYDDTTDFNTDYGPQDPTDLRADWGLSEFDERHKVVIAAVFDSPWKNSFLEGFELSPIFTYHSGLPFNLLAGGEVNGDNHTTNERPIGAGRDTGLGPDYTNLDMRLSWTHRVTEKTKVQLTAEGFNVANHTNFASVNNVVSPLFGLILPGGAACPVAGTCATGNTTFHVHGSAALSPSTPLGFTSDFPKREIQLGLRFIF